MLFVEEQFGVQTHIIPVDFNDGPAVYQRIRAEIEGKEIGILSKFSRRISEMNVFGDEIVIEKTTRENYLQLFKTCVNDYWIYCIVYIDLLQWTMLVWCMTIRSYSWMYQKM